MMDPDKFNQILLTGVQFSFHSWDSFVAYAFPGEPLSKEHTQIDWMAATLRIMATSPDQDTNDWREVLLRKFPELGTESWEAYFNVLNAVSSTAHRLKTSGTLPGNQLPLAFRRCLKQ